MNEDLISPIRDQNNPDGYLIFEWGDFDDKIDMGELVKD